MNDNAEEVMDFTDEIMNLFDYVLQKATIDMKDFEIIKKRYRERLIKLFEHYDEL